MNVLALDPSLTCTGWAMTDASGETVCGTLKPKLRGMGRISFLLEGVRKLLDPVPDLVVLEGYSYGSRGRAAISLGEWGGVLRYELYRNLIRVAELAPAQRCKLATGKGNAPKEQVLAEAIRRLGYAGASHDEADALWLLEAARQWYDLPGAVTLPKSHRQTLEKASWPTIG